MVGGPGADEFRCNGAFDSVEDYNPDEGDTIVEECESGGRISACSELAIFGTYIDYKTCHHVTIDTWINWVRTPRGMDIGNGDIIDSRLIDSGTVIVDFEGNIPKELWRSSHIELKVDDGPYTPVTSPHTITGLSKGAKHTIYVRAVDQGGGPDLTPAKWMFTIAVITELAGPKDAIPVDPIIPPEKDTGGGGGIINNKPPVAIEPIPENDTGDDDSDGGSNTTASNN
jgi:hypothetical protein